jgi:hypothetical protein
VAETFYEAWQVRDRGCAESIGSAEAIDALFALDGSNTEGMLEACDPGDEIDGDEGGNGAGGSAAPVSVCTFRYEGGSALFDLRFGATVGWQVTAVDFRGD